MKPQKKIETDKEEVKEEKSMEETENALYPFCFLTKCLKNILAIQRQARHHLPQNAYVNFNCHCISNFIMNSIIGCQQLVEARRVKLIRIKMSRNSAFFRLR